MQLLKVIKPIDEYLIIQRTCIFEVILAYFIDKNKLNPINNAEALQLWNRYEFYSASYIKKKKKQKKTCQLSYIKSHY